MLVQSDAACVYAEAPRSLRVSFTGSGSEYFRIWIVNLLLTVLTLSLYLPFARARRLRYFYANTLIGGHALGFHGRPWPLFRGYALICCLVLTIGMAEMLTPAAAPLAYLLLFALWPALWRAGLQYRLSNTRWRGLRLGFHGDLLGAYRAFVPLYLPAMTVMAGVGLALLRIRYAELELGLWLPQVLVLSGLALLLLLAPRALASIKRYQHAGYGYAGQRSQLLPGTGAFYGLVAKTLLLPLLPIILLGIFAGITAGTVLQPSRQDLMSSIGGGALLGLLLGLLGGAPYFVARLQNLVWNGTRSAGLGFRSALRMRSMVWLYLVNGLLTALTLGLYFPFAAIRTARLRLEAVTLKTAGDSEDWQAAASDEMQDASGEAAADFFGLDLAW